MRSPESFWDAVRGKPGEYIQSAIDRLGLSKNDVRRLYVAMDRLWNAYAIRCLGKYYTVDDIHNVIFDRFDASAFAKAVKYVKPSHGSGTTYQLASAIFLFFAFGEAIEAEYQKGEMTDYRMRLIVLSFLYDTTFYGDGKAYSSKYRISFEDKESPEASLNFLRSYINEREKEEKSDFFILPKQVMNMDLTRGELLVYTALMYFENRKTYSCYPTFETIGKMVHMSRNSVCTHVDGLRKKGLIETEETQIRNKEGVKRNGALLYHIKPMSEAWEAFDRRQMKLLQEEAARVNAQKAIEEYDRKHGKKSEEAAKSAVI